jgi:hypothetical protein
MENILRQGEKMGQRLKELRDAYEEIQDSDDPDIANAYDPVIAGSLKELASSIGNTSLRNMTIEQLSKEVREIQIQKKEKDLKKKQGDLEKLLKTPGAAAIYQKLQDAATQSETEIRTQSADIIEEGDRNGVCTLMQYLFISLAKGVMLNNAFRFCQNPECGRLFTPKEYDRRADSRYCSEDCQIKAKYLRTFRNSRKSPSTWSSVDQGPESTSIEVTWSTSDIPIRTLRRDQVKLPGDDREPARGSDIEQLLLAQSFIGLTTGWVRTAEILEELKSR